MKSLKSLNLGHFAHIIPWRMFELIGLGLLLILIPSATAIAITIWSRLRREPR